MKPNKTREMLKERYLDALKEDKIPWERGWGASRLYNGTSNHTYKGVNKMLLQYLCTERGYTDPRFYTFNQVKNMGLHLDETAKGNGIPVEFWSLYDRENKKTISSEDYEKIKKEEPERAEKIRWLCRNYYVFNASHVKGLEPLQEQKIEPFDDSRLKLFTENLIKNMDVDYSEPVGNERAYYNSAKDRVVLPPSDSFRSEEDYYAVKLHELAHATGHESRLNRPLGNTFGSIDYAKEELRAEIASSFVNSGLGIISSSVMENHKAYIQSWIRIIEDKESELFSAISDAEKIADYMEKTGGINLKMEEKKKPSLKVDIELEEGESLSEMLDDEERLSVDNIKKFQSLIINVKESGESLLTNLKIETEKVKDASDKGKSLSEVVLEEAKEQGTGERFIEKLSEEKEQEILTETMNF